LRGLSGKLRLVFERYFGPTEKAGLDGQHRERTRGFSVLAGTALAAAAAVALAGCQAQAPAPLRSGSAATGKSGNVFVINLENKSYDTTWGPDSDSPYLSETLRSQGVLLTKYYAIAHHSNHNYIAQLSGQAANPATKNGCGTYAPFIPTGTESPGQLKGAGCIYPAKPADCWS
jgi:hypothetical protein